MLLILTCLKWFPLLIVVSKKMQTISFAILHTQNVSKKGGVQRLSIGEIWVFRAIQLVLPTNAELMYKKNSKAD